MLIDTFSFALLKIDSIRSSVSGNESLESSELNLRSLLLRAVTLTAEVSGQVGGARVKDFDFVKEPSALVNIECLISSIF